MSNRILLVSIHSAGLQDGGYSSRASETTTLAIVDTVLTRGFSLVLRNAKRFMLEVRNSNRRRVVWTEQVAQNAPTNLASDASQPTHCTAVSCENELSLRSLLIDPREHHE